VAIAAVNSLGQGALLHLANGIEQGHPPSARRGWQAAKSNIWRLLGIWPLVGVPAAVAALARLLPTLLTFVQTVTGADSGYLDLNGQQTEMLATLGACCCLEFPLSLVTVPPFYLASLVCVVEGQGTVRSIVRGTRLALANVRPVAALWLRLMLIEIAVVLALSIPVCLVSAVLVASEQAPTSAPLSPGTGNI
jgi:hypothetical protein